MKTRIIKGSAVCNNTQNKRISITKIRRLPTDSLKGLITNKPHRLRESIKLKLLEQRKAVPKAIGAAGHPREVTDSKSSSRLRRPSRCSIKFLMIKRAKCCKTFISKTCIAQTCCLASMTLKNKELYIRITPILVRLNPLRFKSRRSSNNSKIITLSHPCSKQILSSIGSSSRLNHSRACTMSVKIML